MFLGVSEAFNLQTIDISGDFGFDFHSATFIGGDNAFYVLVIRDPYPEDSPTARWFDTGDLNWLWSRETLVELVNSAVVVLGTAGNQQQRCD